MPYFNINDKAQYLYTKNLTEILKGSGESVACKSRTTFQKLYDAGVSSLGLSRFGLSTFEDRIKTLYHKIWDKNINNPVKQNSELFNKNLRMLYDLCNETNDKITLCNHFKIRVANPTTTSSKIEVLLHGITIDHIQLTDKLNCNNFATDFTIKQNLENDIYVRSLDEFNNSLNLSDGVYLVKANGHYSYYQVNNKQKTILSIKNNLIDNYYKTHKLFELFNKNNRLAHHDLDYIFNEYLVPHPLVYFVFTEMLTESSINIPNKTPVDYTQNGLSLDVDNGLPIPKKNKINTNLSIKFSHNTKILNSNEKNIEYDNDSKLTIYNEKNMIVAPNTAYNYLQNVIVDFCCKNVICKQQMTNTIKLAIKHTHHLLYQNNSQTSFNLNLEHIKYNTKLFDLLTKAKCQEYMKIIYSYPNNVVSNSEFILNNDNYTNYTKKLTSWANSFMQSGLDQINPFKLLANFENNLMEFLLPTLDSIKESTTFQVKDLIFIHDLLQIKDEHNTNINAIAAVTHIFVQLKKIKHILADRIYEILEIYLPLDDWQIDFGVSDWQSTGNFNKMNNHNGSVSQNISLTYPIRSEKNKKHILTADKQLPNIPQTINSVYPAPSVNPPANFLDDLLTLAKKLFLKKINEQEHQYNDEEYKKITNSWCHLHNNILGSGFNENQKKLFHLANSRLVLFVSITKYLTQALYATLPSYYTFGNDIPELNNYKSIDETRYEALQQAQKALKTKHGIDLLPDEISQVVQFFMDSRYQW